MGFSQSSFPLFPDEPKTTVIIPSKMVVFFHCLNVIYIHINLFVYLNVTSVYLCLMYSYINYAVLYNS